MKARYLITCVVVSLSSCRDGVSHDGRNDGIVAPHFEDITKGGKRNPIKSGSQSIEINGIKFFDCLFSEDRSGIEMKFSEAEAAVEFNIPRSGLSIQSIGFQSAQNIVNLVNNVERDAKVIANAALIFGNGSKVKFVSNGSFLIIFSDEGVVDEFVMVVSCENERFVWFNPKVSLNGFGEEICHWLANRISLETLPGF